MLSVYVTGGAILAWRKFHLAGVWRSVFAVTATTVLYLNVCVFLVRPLSGPAPFGLLEFSPLGAISMVMQSLFAALFGGLAILAARRFHDGRTGSFSPKNTFNSAAGKKMAKRHRTKAGKSG
jgi:hypothetical protein